MLTKLLNEEIHLYSKIERIFDLLEYCHSDEGGILKTSFLKKFHHLLKISFGGHPSQTDAFKNVQS